MATGWAETGGCGQIPANLGASSLVHITDMAFTPMLDLVMNLLRQNGSISTENTLVRRRQNKTGLGKGIK